MGRTSTGEALPSGRPKKATDVEIVKQLNDRKIKLRELAANIGISKEQMGHIVHDDLELPMQ